MKHLVDRLIYKSKRVVIRSGRIAAGAALLLICFVSCSAAIDSLSLPISQMSVLGLLWGGVLAVVSFWAFIWSFTVAFGEPPDTPDDADGG